MRRQLLFSMKKPWPRRKGRMPAYSREGVKEFIASWPSGWMSSGNVLPRINPRIAPTRAAAIW